MGLIDRLLRSPRADLPAEVLQRLGLEDGEKVLAAALLTDGAAAVATRQRLLVGDEASRRLDVPWHEVDHAAWEPDSAVLDIRLVSGRRVRLSADPGAPTLLPEVVRERVQSSVVLGRKVEIHGRRGVRVVVRRTPHGLVTQVLPDAGVDLSDPLVAGEVTGLRDELARAAGMAEPR